MWPSAVPEFPHGNTELELGSDCPLQMQAPSSCFPF